MLTSILLFLLGLAVTLVGGACLVRAYMRWQRISFVQPLGQFILALTDRLVLPLQRVLPGFRGRLDVASLVAAWLLKLLQAAVVMSLLGLSAWTLLPVLALLGLLRLALSVGMAVVVVAAILSWTQQRSPQRDLVQRLSEPLLAPLRRVLPLIGGVDLSPLLALVLMQVLAMLVAGLQAGLLGQAAGAAAILG